MSSALDGPNNCSHASATTCGAIISGSTKQKTKALRPRISVSPTSTATVAPISTASTVPPHAVTRLCCVAVQVVLLDRTLASATVENRPFGATPSNSSRASGSSDRIATIATSTHNSAVSSARSRQPAVSAIVARRRLEIQLPKSSAKRFRLALLFCTTLPMSVGISLMIVPGGSHDGAPMLALAGM